YFITNILKGDFTPKEPVHPKNLILEEKIIEADTTTARHLGVSDNKLNQPFEVATTEVKDIITICKENNLIPILVTTPQTYLYNDRIGEKIMKSIFILKL
ncbi:MAG: hypothetical protein ACRC6A_11025, partial [Fusobacteriaceae bacterium]